MNYRKKLSDKYLIGKGIEFGALHNPLYVHKQNQVVYADKYSKKDLLKNFQELESVQEAIVETDIYFDLNQNNWQSLTDNDFNFFIANHVIEHLINPLKFLAGISEVMNSGSYLYLAIPDKEYTFDCDRQLTTWEHLYQEYVQNTTKLSQSHLDDFVHNITKDHIQDLQRKKRLYDDYDNWFKRFAIARWHRRRSIHVHVWNQATFDHFIHQAIAQLKLRLKLVEQVDSNTTKHEMIYILEKVTLYNE